MFRIPRSFQGKIDLHSQSHSQIRQEIDVDKDLDLDLYKNTNKIILFIKRDNYIVDISTLSHEIFHLTLRICESEDIIDEEVMATLNGELNSYIIKKILEYGESIKYNIHKSIKSNMIKK
mgnify:CR=1 FL=1